MRDASPEDATPTVAAGEPAAGVPARPFAESAALTRVPGGGAWPVAGPPAPTAEAMAPPAGAARYRWLDRGRRAGPPAAAGPEAARAARASRVVRVREVETHYEYHYEYVYGDEDR